MATRGRPTRPRSARKAEAREALLIAVADLLAQGPAYADISMNAIAAEAGLAKSTFYQYFTGKNDLLRSYVEELNEQAGPAIAWLQSDGPPPSAELFAEMLHGKLAAYRRRLPLIAAAFDAAYFDLEVKAPVDQLMQRLDDAGEAHILAGQAGGWIDAQLPARETATWLNWMLSRGLHKLALHAEDRRADARITGFSHLVWSVLYAAPAEA